MQSEIYEKSEHRLNNEQTLLHNTFPSRVQNDRTAHQGTQNTGSIGHLASLFSARPFAIPVPHIPRTSSVRCPLSQTANESKRNACKCACSPWFSVASLKFIFVAFMEQRVSSSPPLHPSCPPLLLSPLPTPSLLSLPPHRLYLKL